MNPSRGFPGDISARIFWRGLMFMGVSKPGYGYIDLLWWEPLCFHHSSFNG
jgi:hypothetical protein